MIKTFDPVPLRQTQPFKHNKKNKAELWWSFCCASTSAALGLGRIAMAIGGRFWPAGIANPNGQPYGPG